MLEIIIGDNDKTHNQALKDICFRYTFRENIDSEIHVMETVKEIEDYMQSLDLKLIMILGTKLLTKEEKQKSESWSRNYIVLMADSFPEVMEAVTPSFRPSGLLLKPVEKEKMEQLLDEIWNDYKIAVKDKEMFLVKIKNREYAIPKDSIYFFESRNKKIIVRTAGQELEFYDTLDHLKERLGDHFIRVHKSFLVNIEQVEMIHFTNMTIHFPGGAFALLSRSYKAEVQSQWKKREKRKAGEGL